MKRLLLVDGSAEKRLLHSDLTFLEKGFEVTSMEDPIRALKETQKHPFDLILLELGLDDFLAPRLEPFFDLSNLVLVLEEKNFDRVPLFLQRGAVDCLKKPLNEGSLRLCLARLERWTTLQSQNNRLLEEQENLARSREKLIELTHGLEGMVNERTRELEDSNRALEIAYRDLIRSHRLMQETQSKLIEQEKMAAVGLLSAGVAHQINNPLGFVTSNLATLEEYTWSLRRMANLLLHHHQNQGEKSSSSDSDRAFSLIERIVQDERLEQVLEDIDPLFEEMSSGLSRIKEIVKDLGTFAESGAETEVVEINFEEELNRLKKLLGGSLGAIEEFHVDAKQRFPLYAPVKIFRQILLNLILMINKLSEQKKCDLVMQTRFLENHGELNLILSKKNSQGSKPDFLLGFPKEDWKQEPFLDLGGDITLDRIRKLGWKVQVIQNDKGDLCVTLRFPLPYNSLST